MSRNERVFCPRCQSDDVFPRGGECICGNCHFRFQLPGEEKTFQPLNLFLSYGHTEETICRLINQALKGRGHTTWFDEDKLRHGQDWRQGITDGIKESNGVISCLSRHSVRDPGVCLSELSIAIGVRGGNIKTILLEPEWDVRPPASLCHIQWLDMSDWRNWYDEDKDIFRPGFDSWFNAKMEQLFQVIESDESRAFTGQISAIQEKLHINYSTGKQRDLLQRLFVGREWLTEELERWLDDPKGARLCVLYGDPGVGKSAFAAHYTHYNPRVAAGLFCEYDHPVYNDARTVIMTLAYLLACRLPAYRTALAAVLEQVKQLGSMEAPELFDLLLTKPLELTIDGGHETLCVVIDALDECGQGERNALAEVLTQCDSRLPAWLRVLATSREVAAVKAPLAGAFTLELHGDNSQNQEDVRRYFAERLQESHGGDPDWERVLDAMTERSGGIFLYARLVCEGILAGKLSVHDADSFPDGLSGAFYQWFGWFFPDDGEYKADFRLPLGMLLAAPEPLPKEELKRIFGWDNNRLEDFLRRVEVLLRQDVNDFGKETVTFSHKYLSEWLDTERAGRFRSDRTAALERMAERFYKMYRKDAKTLTEYESLHLAALLERCGNTTALAEVTMSRDLYVNIINAGHYCDTWGKLAAALACYAQARVMAERMVQERGTLDDRRYQSIGYNMIACILWEKGDLDGALELFQKNMKIREQMVSERNTSKDRSDLGFIYMNVAGILREKGDLDGALELYRKDMKIQEQLALEQGTPEGCSMLGFSYNNVADILRGKGDLGGALELFQKGMEIRDWLVRERGTPDDYQNLSISRAGIARILRDKGDLDGALGFYQKNINVWEQLVRERGTPGDRNNLVSGYVDVADILRDKGDLDGALELFQKCMGIREQLVQEYGTPRSRSLLGDSNRRIAYILWLKGNLDEALELYQKSMEISEQLVRERGTPNDRSGMSVSYSDLAEILKAKGDLDGALGLYQKYQEISEQLVRERGMPNDRSNLGSSYQKIATILWLKGNLDEARGLYQKYLEIAEQLVRERGTDSDYDDLAVACLFLAALSVLTDAERLAHARRGLKLSEQLHKTTGRDRYQRYCKSFQQLIKSLEHRDE